MKKLLVAAIGVATAFGAFADQISQQRFKNVATGPVAKESLAAVLNTAATPSGSYWSDPEGITNEYTVSTVASIPYTGSIDTEPGKALDIKTKFGNPLSVNIIDGGTATNIPNTGLYFDSLVKFTVCDGEPDQTYTGAKIIMWLQTNEAETETNLYVRAGYLSVVNDTVISTPTNYVCAVPGNFAIDGLNRVTIKAIADITSTGRRVPGFAIYMNQTDGDSATTDINSLAAKWDSSFPVGELTEAATEINNGCALFPTLDLTTAPNSLTSVAFDGTGSITDIRFTDVAPTFAADPAAPEVSGVVVDGNARTGIKTLAAAVEAANGASTSAKITLNKSFTIAEALAFSGTAKITLDFAGFVLTNENSYAAITNSAANLVITNSSETVGGIYCSGWEDQEPAVAICNSNSTGKNLAIQAGAFWGLIDIDDWEKENTPGIVVSGGLFTDGGVAAWLDQGKQLEEDETSGMYVVTDIPPVVYYTVNVAAPGSHVSVAISTNTVEIGTAGGQYTVDAGADVAVVYTPDAGYELTGTASFEFSPIAENETIETAPTASALSYAVTYTLTAASEAGSAPAAGSYTVETTSPYVLAQPEAVTGYTFSGWYDNDQLTGDPVTQFAIDTSALEAKAFYGKFTATTYTVTFYTNSVVYTTANYTYGDSSSYSAPADPSVDGYTFGGWYTDNGTFESAFEFSANVAGNTQVAYAKLTGSAPEEPTIDPETNTPVPVEAGTAEAAKEAVKITPPATSGADAAEYKALFNLKAEPAGEGKFDVSIDSIKDSVEQSVAASAEKLVSGSDATGTITIPAGLYYKVTPSAGLPISGTPVKGLSDGTTTTITKPTGTQGFIKVEIGTAEYK